MEDKARLSAKLWTILVIAATVLLCFLLPGKPISSDVMDMFPEIGDKLAVSQELSKRFDSQLIFAVKGDKAAELLNTSLSQAPFLADFKGKHQEENLTALAKTISDHSLAFLSPKYIELLENPQDYSRRVLSAIYSPFGAPTQGELDRDPLLLTRAALLSFPKQRVSMENNWLTVKIGDTNWRLLFASLKDADNFQELKRNLASLTEIISKAKLSEPGAEIYFQGAPFYSLAAGSQARQDMSKLGTISFVALTLLLLVAYRSIRPLLLCLLSIFVGLVCGLTATNLLCGQLHAVTLVMCISIIGLCTDYTAYFVAARMGAPKKESSLKTLELLRPTLFHAVLTTVLTYSILLFAPFPTLRQLAVFTVFGLVGACLTVLFWFPYLTKSIRHYDSPLAPLAQKYIRFWYPSSCVGKIILCAILVFCALGISRTQVSDDLRNLYQAPKALVESEAQIQKILNRDFSQGTLLLEADSEEKLLESFALLRTRLAENSKLDGMAAFIPPLLPEKQQNRAKIAAGQALTIVKDSLEKLNIRPNSHLQYSLLSFKDFLASPVGENYRSLFVEKEGKYYYSIPIGSSAVPKSILQGLPVQASFEYKRNQIQSIMAQYRVHIGWLLVCAFAAIILSIQWKFGYRAALLSAFSLLLSLLAGTAALGFFGMSFNVFSLFALILILGIGIDYQIFFLRLSEMRENSLFALFVAAASTILSLGILGLSETAAVRNFGITLSFGVLTAFLTSPISLLLSHEKIRRF